MQRWVEFSFILVTIGDVFELIFSCFIGLTVVKQKRLDSRRVVDNMDVEPIHHPFPSVSRAFPLHPLGGR